MKTKMKCMLLAFMVCLVGTTYAQEKESNDGVKFVENMTFDQALALAKKENKLLFIDCYTSWCGPCKMMARDVFTQKIVGDYFNPKFVSMKVDMEKGEGVQLKDKFEVKAFPTFVILNGNGEIISRLVGGGKAEEFIKRVENSLSEKGLLALQKRYNAGERGTEFLNDYIKALSEAYLSDECAKVAEEMLAGKDADLLQNEMLFAIFVEHINSPEAPSFQYVLSHKNDFIQKYGEQKVSMKLNRVWFSYPNSFIKKEANGNVTFDEAKMKEYITMMEKNDVKNAKEIAALTYIQAADAMKNWRQYVELCSDFQKNFKASDMYIYNWARRIEMNSKDADLRNTAASWIEKRVKELEEEAKTQKADPNAAISMTGGPTWIKPYQELLSKLKS